MIWIYLSEVQGRDVEKLSVGDFLDLPATPMRDLEPDGQLATLLGLADTNAGHMSCAQGSPPRAHVQQICGVIERIDAVTAREHRVPIDERADLVEPAAGTSQRHPVQRLGDGWTQPDAPRQLFGYLVWLHDRLDS